MEALRAENRRIEKIIVADGAHEKRLAEILYLARQNGVAFQKTAKENFSKYIEPGANHQGVIAFVAAADYYSSEKLLGEIYQKIKAGEKPLIVVLDGVEDPRNFGAILRESNARARTAFLFPNAAPSG